ncbi:plasmid partition protein ParG [Salmonella enterica subsp. enterica]|nr:DNA partition complex ParG [Salmonella enterica]EDZ8322516.1 DNA partition complex ParG [Salmonella enterica]EEE8158190.1 DNA partition complex ParG [Salmonella enterica subsp. enterica serovar Badagry]EIN7308241.1 DNA partition complex ParG [Salmonella enterica subsp. enterica serovar Telelkebir]HAK8439716.1 DNA partition complex ParG [Salmonella enterica]
MALSKQNTGTIAPRKVMTFGENRDLDKVITTTPPVSQKRINFNMPEDKHQRLKAACARKGISISDVMNELTDEWLKVNE